MINGLTKEGLIKTFLLFLVILFVFSCNRENKTEEEMKEYEGPMLESDSIEVVFSDSARTKVVLTAPKQYEEQSGDQYFPNGIHVDFYEFDGTISSTLTANTAKFHKEKNFYEVNGNVEINSTSEKKTLTSEHLNWDPATGMVNTDKFVKIETEKEVLTGTGLKAKEDFSWYEFTQVEGIFQKGL